MNFQRVYGLAFPAAFGALHTIFLHEGWRTLSSAKNKVVDKPHGGQAATVTFTFIGDIKVEVELDGGPKPRPEDKNKWVTWIVLRVNVYVLGPSPASKVWMKVAVLSPVGQVYWFDALLAGRTNHRVPYRYKPEATPQPAATTA